MKCSVKKEVKGIKLFCCTGLGLGQNEFAGYLRYETLLQHQTGLAICYMDALLSSTGQYTFSLLELSFIKLFEIFKKTHCLFKRMISNDFIIPFVFYTKILFVFIQNVV